jgi:hypothetical protein
MKIKYYLLLLSLSLILFSCASRNVSPVNLKNYSMNTVKATNIGDAMIKNRKGFFIEEKQWVGLLHSTDGWYYNNYYSDESFQEELIYTGRIDDIIHISFREYKKDFARPAFFQELVYDLKKSDRIVFKQYKLQVIDATNEHIKFKVLTD